MNMETVLYITLAILLGAMVVPVAIFVFVGACIILIAIDYGLFLLAVEIYARVVNWRKGKGYK